MRSRLGEALFLGMIMFGRVVVAAAAAAAVLVGSLATAVHAQPPPRCGMQYTPDDLYWRTNSPPVASVMARLPVGKRHTSGNMLSLNYAADANGKLLQKTEFAKQWDYIFGTNTSTGYGRLVRGNWAPGADSSWGNSTRISQKNLSECVVDGTTTAICLGIPSHPTIPPNSLGHHTGWMILDKASPDPGSLVNLGVGDKACLSYRLMLSTNYDLRTGYNAKFPGFASSPEGFLPPNDHLCEGTTRQINRGDRFSTRITFSGSVHETTGSGRILNHFRDDFLPMTCARSYTINEMHADDPRRDDLSRGVWYRVEHELVMNTNYNPAPEQKSGAISRIWIYNDRTNELVTTFEKRDSLTFKGVNYPFMPRHDPTGKINGMFVSMMQTSSEIQHKRDFAIAVRGFELYLK
jgi:hypothetical protein